MWTIKHADQCSGIILDKEETKTKITFKICDKSNLLHQFLPKKGINQVNRIGICICGKNVTKKDST